MITLARLATAWEGTQAAPPKVKAAARNSGPIIHGSGVFSHAKTAPPIAQSSRLTSGLMKVSRAGFPCDAEASERSQPADFAGWHSHGSVVVDTFLDTR